MKHVYRTYLLWLAIFLVAAANCRILLRNPLNNDVSWYLYVGQELLAGKHLYTDIVETNPPLICFLSVAPVWLAGTTGIAVKPVWVFLLTLLVTALCFAAASLWSRARGSGTVERQVTLLYLPVTSLAFFFAFDFGQRDHLAFVASLAAIGLIAARVADAPVPPGTMLGVSVVSGVLLALKPFFLIPWLLCVLYQSRVRGWQTVARLPETYIVPAMSLVQPLLVIFVTPAYFRIAQIVSSLYSSYNTETWGSLLRGKFLLAALVGASLTLLYRPSERSRASVRLASLTAAGWILSGLLQRKGWHYHVLPAVAACGFAAWMILLDIAARPAGEVRRLRQAPQWAGLLLLCFAALRTLLLHWDYAPGTKELIPIVEREAPHGNIVGLSTGMFLFPLVNETGVHFGVHYNSLWPLPGLYADQIRNVSGALKWHYRRPEQMGAVEKEMVNQIYSDVAAEPNLIIFARPKELQGMGSLSVDLPEYFRQDARIREVMAHYETVPFAGEFLILRHRPPASP
jgi:hypothetical protein